jgi:hypothetical protein
MRRPRGTGAAAAAALPVDDFPKRFPRGIEGLVILALRSSTVRIGERSRLMLSFGGSVGLALRDDARVFDFLFEVGVGLRPL